MGKDERIKKEIKRLDDIFKNIDEDRYKTAEKLIQNAAFMSVQMEDMQSRINEQGVTIEYKNGENQYGFKKSPDVETYNSFIKQYTTIIDKLISLLPKTVEETENIFNLLKKPK